MSLKCGIVGLPNVGKSTLFNALTKAGIAAENYPFCTIEPNVGIVEVPDPRLAALAAIAKPERVLPAVVEFVDIAGLVAGASKGEGLGNKFLANIRETDAIAHVVRCFVDDNVVHVTGGVNPLSDIETINTELALADLAAVEKQVAKAEKPARAGDKEAQRVLAVLRKVEAVLDTGRPARTADLYHEEIAVLAPLAGVLLAALDRLGDAVDGLLDDREVGQRQLGVDRIDVRDRVHAAGHVHHVVIDEAAHDVRDGIGLADVRQELVAQALALGRAGDQARDVDELDGGGKDTLRARDRRQRRESWIGYLDDADVGFDGTERVILSRDAGLGQGIKQRGLADVGQAYYAAFDAHLTSFFSGGSSLACVCSSCIARSVSPATSRGQTTITRVIAPSIASRSIVDGGCRT